jgi:NAD-dependent deacetylase
LDSSTVAKSIISCEKILFITGAGISADSGLPTYRGIGGLYENNLTDEGVPIETALSGAFFNKNPEISWKYLWQIGHACSGASPNPAHYVIAKIQYRKPDCWILTQNVDGLHRAAGTENLIEAHGHAFDLFCTTCESKYSADQIVSSYETEPELPPTCPECSGVIRPDVVLFGELLPQDAVDSMNFLAGRGNDLIICVGTSGYFPYIIDPVLRAREAGKMTVEINPQSTEISELFDIKIRKGAAEALQQIWYQLEEE